MRDALIFFDGHCRFCNAWLRFVLRYERQARYHFAPLQSAFARERLAALGRDAADLSSVVVLDQGRLWLKSEAALHLLEDMRAPWRWLRFVRVLPLAWRDAVYDLVGRWRYRLFGRSSYCAAAQGKARARFVDLTENES